MKIDRNTKAFILPGEDGHDLTIRYDNRGEPYREGVRIDLSNGYDTIASVFLDEREGIELRNMLNRLFPSPLIQAVEDVVADLGNWLTDNTVDVFEEQPDIDGARLKLWTALEGLRTEPFFIEDHVIRRILECKDVGAGRAAIMKAIGR